MFKDLDEINARDIKQKHKSTLEALLEIGSNLVEKYRKDIHLNHQTKVRDPNLERICISMQGELATSDYFDEKDIASLIHSLSCISFLKEESVLFGVYTSALADTLSDRNSKEGKETHLFIEDSHLDYLFAYLKKPAVVSIKNSTGDFILSNAAFSADSIKYIFLDNIKGDNLLNYAAENVRAVQIHNCIGNNIADNIRGADLLDIQNCTGTSIGHSPFGAKNIFAKKITGDLLLNADHSSSTSLKKIDFIVLENIIGDDTFSLNNTFSSDFKINLILLKNIAGNNTAHGFNYVHAHLLYLDKIDGNNILEYGKSIQTLFHIDGEWDPPEVMEKHLFHGHPKDILLTRDINTSLNHLPTNRVFTKGRLVKHAIHTTSELLEEEKVSKELIDKQNDFKKQKENYCIDEVYRLFNSLKFGDIQNIEETLAKLDSVKEVGKRLYEKDELLQIGLRNIFSSVRETAQQKTTVETLLRTGHAMVKEYVSRLPYTSNLISEQQKEAFSLYSNMLSQLDSLPTFNEQDISLLISVSDVCTSTYSFTEDEQKVFGFYTSALVDTLTKRNKKEGKQTIISIENSRLNYLFHYVQNADVISIKNSTGNFILSNAATFGGSIDHIFLNWITGDNLLSFTSAKIENAVYEAEFKTGTIGTVQIQDCEGNKIAAGTHSIDFLAIESSSGDDIASQSHNKRTFLKDIQGDNVAYGISGTKEQQLGFLVMQDIVGNSIENYVYDKEDSYIDLVLSKNIKNKDIGNNVSTVSSSYFHLLYLQLKNLGFRTQIRSYRINKLYGLLNLVSSCVETMSEIQSELEEIDTVYKLIKPIKIKGAE